LLILSETKPFGLSAHASQAKENEKYMKKGRKQEKDELRPEYKPSDFTGPLVRGKYAKRLRESSAKSKRKLTAAEKAEKRRRQKEYTTIFINGKQRRVKRPPTIDGIDIDEFIRRNADPIWLHQNEMWEYMVDEDES
jgi:hypothetical protein